MLPEQYNIEYKTASKGRLPKDIWKTISAFSNSEGGKIYFGIRPDGSKEFLSNSELDKIQSDLATICSQEFNVRITPEIRIQEDLVISVFEPAVSSSRPVYHKKQGIEKGTFIRVGSVNQLADEEIIKRLITASTGGAEGLDYAYNWRDVLDKTLVDEFISMLNNRNDNIYQNFSTPEILIKQKVITRDQSRVTLFGLLAFSAGRELQDIISPTVNIAVTVYPGTQKVNDLDPSETYIDNKEFNGPVIMQYRNAYSYIKQRIPTRGIVQDGIRRDIMSIPEIAIRESLANAIVHRDYSTYASRIQVDIFSDRIEITNPGNSLVPIAELDSAPSTSRNPILMNYMKEYGITDQKGRGIRTIYSALNERDLIAPKFYDNGRSFKVILFSESLFSAEDREYIEALNLPLNHREERAIAYARHHPEGISNSTYRELNNMQAVRDDKKANKELGNLVDRGIFFAEGDGKGRRYHFKAA
ncbi:putative DNA binding domain-containing protein [Candidatus Saccharibacteria bacterium]|nr:putative DNA binding domain-containing protein [Candidatus Saccharibacteria bacterium]